jgi:hypothetical protein
MRAMLADVCRAAGHELPGVRLRPCAGGTRRRAGQRLDQARHERCRQTIDTRPALVDLSRRAARAAHLDRRPAALRSAGAHEARFLCENGLHAVCGLVPPLIYSERLSDFVGAFFSAFFAVCRHAPAGLPERLALAGRPCAARIRASVGTACGTGSTNASSIGLPWLMANCCLSGQP